MTVSELIQKLKEMPQDADIELSNGEGLAHSGVVRVDMKDGAVVLY